MTVVYMRAGLGYQSSFYQGKYCDLRALMTVSSKKEKLFHDNLRGKPHQCS